MSKGGKGGGKGGEEAQRKVLEDLFLLSPAAIAATTCGHVRCHAECEAVKRSRQPYYGVVALLGMQVGVYAFGMWKNTLACIYLI